MADNVENKRWWSNLKAGEIVGWALGVAGIIVGLLSWSEARESRRIASEANAVSQKTFDRTAGKIPAKLSFVGHSPEGPAQAPPGLVTKGLTGEKQIRLLSLDDLRELDLCLLVRNDGDEIIDALRVETKIANAAFHNKGGPPEKEIGMMPRWGLAQPFREDVELAQKLMPHQKAKVQLTRGILKQILSSTVLENLDKDHYGVFEIKCYARIIGCNSFDDSDRGAAFRFDLCWVLRGFDPDRCRHFLETTRSQAVLQFDQLGPNKK